MPTFLQRSAALQSLIICLVALAPLLAGNARAQTPPDNAPGASETQQTVPPNRMNWPSAWTSDVKESADQPGGSDKPAGADQAQSQQTDTPAGGTGGPAPAPTQPQPLPQAQPQPQQPAQPPQQDPAQIEPPPAAQTAQPTADPNAPAAPAVAPQPGTAPPAVQGQPAQAPAAAAPVPAEQQSVDLKGQVLKHIEAAKSAAKRLETLSKSVERVRERDEELTKLLPTIEAIIAEAKDTETKLQPALANVRSLIEKLGPPPEEGKSEAEDIAALRKRLNAVAAEIDGAVKTTELAGTGGRQIIARIQEIRLENFRDGLAERSASILSAKVWKDGQSAVPQAGKQLHAVFSEWFARISNRPNEVLIVLALALVAGLGLQIASRRIRMAMRRAAGSGAPTFSQRSIAAGLDAPLRMLPKIVFATIVFVGLGSLDLLYLQIEGLAAAAFKAVIIASAGLAFTTAYLQPGRPQWRVLQVGDSAAWKIRRVIRVGIIVFAIDVLVRQVITELSLPLLVNILWSSLAALSFALIFLFAARIKLEVPEAGNSRLALLGGHVHKAPLLIAAVAIIISVLTGYVALGHLIATRLLILAAACFLLVIFYLANRAIALEPDQNKPSPDSTGTLDAAAAGVRPGLPLDVRRKLARGLSIVLDIALFFIAVPVLLIAFGFSPPEISTLLKQAIFGFEIGGIEISLFKVGVALALFAGIVFASRMLQRWLGDTILHPSRTDQGLGNSIRTGIGYVGFIVAAIAGLSYAGLDITNLAIVAGALSVGIGFGLQSIVNNFVSGLILLVERPIKVGDWIKVGDLQGHVRKISVRSTEIETFERASVIVPNSELISGTVINLTLRNALGRISIPVGVSYDSDPEVVQQLLLECAMESDLVARHPAPFVVFENFGNSSLDFSLRIFVSDVSTSLTAQTQVRKAIFAKFREAGIEIPFPQQDLNLRDTDGLKLALQQLLDERQKLSGQSA